MWPRLVEIGIGLWLIVSPWVLPLPLDLATTLAAVMGGAEVVALGLLSYFTALRKVHLASILVAIWMLAVAYTSTLPAEAPMIANLILTAFLLANFAIIPTEANRPPLAWREFRNRQLRSHYS